MATHKNAGNAQQLLSSESMIQTVGNRRDAHDVNQDDDIEGVEHPEAIVCRSDRACTQSVKNAR